jgi:hypothetical protein
MITGLKAFGLGTIVAALALISAVAPARAAAVLGVSTNCRVSDRRGLQAPVVQPHD